MTDKTFNDFVISENSQTNGEKLNKHFYRKDYLRLKYNRKKRNSLFREKENIKH